ncbi:PAS domain S-box protein [Olivibacter sp. XZL3]|uniref:PAS domain S-box protein n=1 Tax=Olivibacter sp. XZL3 TaxID=1735116 RepID=UPI001064AA91|nr:PAS domain S-box protein [Olivibacter sp. XZL3]
MKDFLEQLKRNLGLKEIFLSKKQMLVGLVDLSVLLTTGYFIIFSLLRSAFLAVFLAIFLVFIVVFRGLIQRQKIRIVYAVHFLIFIITFCLFVPLMYFTGGLYSPITSWLSLPPLISILLFGNAKPTKGWFCTMLFILSVFTVLASNHYTFPNLITAELADIHLFVSMAGLMTCIFFLTIVAEHWKSNVLASLDRTKRMLEKSNEAARIGQWDMNFKDGTINLSKFAKEIIGLNDTRLALDGFIAMAKDKNHFEKLLNGLRDSNPNNEQRIDEEFPLFTFDKVLRWVRFIGIPQYKGEHCIGAYGLIQDIHDQKNAEYNLIKERQRLKYVLQGANLGTWELNVQTEEIILNEQWASFLGYQLNEVQPITATAFKEFIYPEDLDRATAAWRDYDEGKIDTFQCELRMKHKSGDLVWMLIKGKILTWNEAGAPLWMYGTHLENTNEKRLQENLRSSENYARSLIASIPDLLFVLSEDGEFLDYKSHEQELYTKPTLFLGKKVKEIFPDELGMLMEEKIIQSIHTHSLVEFAYDLELHGERKYYQARVVPFEDNKVMVLCRDNTENFMAEKELRTLNTKFKSILHNSPVGIALIDYFSGKYLEVNPAISLFMGYSEKELLQLSFTDLTPEAYRESDLLQMKQLYDFGRFDNYEKEYIRKDGERIWVFITGVAFTDLGGEKSILCIIKDISLQKEQERAYKAAKEQAEIANSAKSEFLANISHEMRTPLNAIIGFTDLLLNSPLNETQTQYVNTVFQSGQSLLELINDLLDLSKIEAGKLDLTIESVDLKKLAKQVVETLQYQADKKGLDFRLALSTKVPQLVALDGQRLRQILFNLLGNALKFTEKGNVELSIQLEHQVSDKEMILRFSVSDTGPGIAEENRQKIFEAFVQENSSIIKRFGGTGLGLTVSNKLLALMGSKLELKSEIGRGSTFYFDLKLCAIAKGDRPKTRPPLPATANGHLTRDVSILLAEDNQTNMLLLKSYFNNIMPNARLLEAGDGQVALNLFKTYRPHLLITDLQMPGMDGFELTTAIRSLNEGKEVPIIALTAGIMNGEKERCLTIGMNDYLSKPILQDALRGVLEKWLTEEQKQLVTCVEEQKPVTLFNLSERLSKVLNVKIEDAVEIVDVAKQTLMEALIEVELFAEKKDMAAIKHTVHKIRATALMMGFSAMHKVAYEIETSLMPLWEVEPMINTLKNEVEYVLSYL